ncbi:hypothetical protein [Bdellovibrio sp. HCB337]|uniref:hypothetical protein n=1 Tax=Bdellovibrio sp. HCB337 TaxID=3394358 RepID=UPI0039A6820C
MKLVAFLIVLAFTAACSHTGVTANTVVQNKTPSLVAESWLKCPPPNPRRPQLCQEGCCGDGSNWFMSCITFVGETTHEAYGKVDPELMQGYSKNPPYEYGNPMLAWAAMQKVGRARTDFENIEAGSAVFFSIPTFPRGHIAIYTGEKDANGTPLIITTGGYKDKTLRKEPMTKTASDVNAQILGWAKL